LSESSEKGWPSPLGNLKKRLGEAQSGHEFWKAGNWKRSIQLVSEWWSYKEKQLGEMGKGTTESIIQKNIRKKLSSVTLFEEGQPVIKG